ncbi:hypothetical protein QJS04_geneDACA005476 [Acorus gramineus]|uniref:Uncharacterized protein n=1 Tax=Acorus gramineus TaxID=55184 RepID=A0AAV9A6W2_ACOGR|nr:hypothetical protein QJS04_geneDACA005476 [Acorus gramineus]
MLLAVEGGGFFSSSASGYSKGLALLLLGRGSEERPMRVSPCYQYHQLAEHGQPDPDLQLASKTTKKTRLSCGCGAAICFGRASSTGKPDGPSVPKVGHDENGVDGTESSKKVCLKSSLKKPPSECPAVIGRCNGDVGENACEVPDGDHNDSSMCAERRKVQWTDACGRELVEIKEFELSELGASDDELDGEGDRRCKCVIQ